MLVAHLSAQAVQKSALVTVVADSSGPVKGLAARDFKVLEDKTSREVISVERAEEQLFISLLVDTTKPPMGMQYPTQDVRGALSTFAKTIQSAGASAQFSLMEFAGAAVTTQDFTANGGALDKVIQRLYQNPQGTAVLIEAMSEASKKIADKPTPRRAIVSIDFRSPETSADQTLKKTAEEVRKSGATVWAVSIGVQSSSEPREALLNNVTQVSGGMRLTAIEASGLESLLTKVAYSLLSQYTVTFARPDNSPMKPVRMETTKGPKVLLTQWMR